MIHWIIFINGKNGLEKRRKIEITIRKEGHLLLVARAIPVIIDHRRSESDFSGGTRLDASLCNIKKIALCDGGEVHFRSSNRFNE